MDSRIAYIQQFIEKPYYSEPIWLSSVPATGILNANFTNEKVKFVLGLSFFLSYNDNAITTYTDQYGQVLFSTPDVSLNPSQNTGMWAFPYIFRGARININTSNLVNTRFSICFQKVWDFKDKPGNTLQV